MAVHKRIMCNLSRMEDASCGNSVCQTRNMWRERHSQLLGGVPRQRKLWQLSVPDSEYVARETQPIAWRGTSSRNFSNGLHAYTIVADYSGTLTLTCVVIDTCAMLETTIGPSRMTLADNVRIRDTLDGRTTFTPLLRHWLKTRRTGISHISDNNDICLQSAITPLCLALVGVMLFG